MSLQFYQKQFEKIIRENQLYIRKYQDLCNIQLKNKQKIISLFDKLFPTIDRFNNLQKHVKDIEPLTLYYFEKVNWWKEKHFKSTIQLVLEQKDQSLQNLQQFNKKQQQTINELLLMQNDPQFYQTLKTLKKEKEIKKQTKIKQLQEQIDCFQQRQEKYLTKIQNLKRMIMELEYELTSNELTNQKITKYYQNLNERHEEQIKQLQKTLKKRQQNTDNINLKKKKQYTITKNQQQKQKKKDQEFENEQQDEIEIDQSNQFNKFEEQAMQNQTKNINQTSFIEKYERNAVQQNFSQQNTNHESRVNISLNGKTYNCYTHNQNWFDPSQQTDSTELKRSNQFYKKQKIRSNTPIAIINNDSRYKKIQNLNKKSLP